MSSVNEKVPAKQTKVLYEVPNVIKLSNFLPLPVRSVETQNLELIKRNTDGTNSPGCDSCFSPSAETNQQNSVRDAVQWTQIQIIAISEAI